MVGRVSAPSGRGRRASRTALLSAAYLNWGPCQALWGGVVVFGGGLVGSVDARAYLGPRLGGR